MLDSASQLKSSAALIGVFTAYRRGCVTTSIATTTICNYKLKSVPRTVAIQETR